MLIVHTTIIVRVTFYMSSATVHSTVTTIQISIMAALKPTLDCSHTDRHCVVSGGFGKYNIKSWVACAFSWSIHKTNFKITKYKEHKNTVLFKQKDLIQHAMNFFLNCAAMVTFEIHFTFKFGTDFTLYKNCFQFDLYLHSKDLF
jgi:hypothetical protein